MLVWTDLETTGLPENRTDDRSPVADRQLLEIAVIVTDDDFNEVARVERVFWHEHAQALCDLPEDAARAYGRLHQVDPFVVDMHRKNGLWERCAGSIDFPEKFDLELAKLLAETTVKERQYVDEKGVAKVARDHAQLAGSTISFDRDFLRAYLPVSESLLHYRNLDVSSLNEVAKRTWPSVWEKRPRSAYKAHRAMADIEESIAVAQYYRTALSPRLQAQVAYEKYVAAAGGLNFQGLPCPTWDELPQKIRDNWVAAVA